MGILADNADLFEQHEAEQERQKRMRKRIAREWGEKYEDEEESDSHLGGEPWEH